MTSPLVSQLRDQYSLAWTVQSFLRIEEARILYRRLMVRICICICICVLVIKIRKLIYSIFRRTGATLIGRTSSRPSTMATPWPASQVAIGIILQGRQIFACNDYILSCCIIEDWWLNSSNLVPDIFFTPHQVSLTRDISPSLDLRLALTTRWPWDTKWKIEEKKPECKKLRTHLSLLGDNPDT